MIFEYYSIIIALFIPIAIVYFQEQKGYTEKYLEYNLNIKIYLYYLSISFIIYSLISISNDFNIPSKISSYFIGKMIIVDNIFKLILIILICQIVQFYIKYYNFRKATGPNKITILFNQLINNYYNIQIKYDWKNKNEKISKLALKNNDLEFQHDSVQIIFNIIYYNNIIYDINIDKINKKYPELIIKYCGSTINKTPIVILPNKYESKKRDADKIIKKCIKCGPNIEVQIAQLVNIIIEDLKNESKNESYTLYNEKIVSLLGGMAYLSQSGLIFNNFYEILRMIYFFMQTELNKNETVKSIIIKLNKYLFLNSINKNNKDYIDDYISICLKHEFIKIFDDGIINEGYIYFIYEVITIYKKEFQQDLKIYNKIISKLFIIASDSTIKEQQEILRQYEDKCYLFEKENIKELSYGIKLIMSNLKKENKIDIIGVTKDKIEEILRTETILDEAFKNYLEFLVHKTSI